MRKIAQDMVVSIAYEVSNEEGLLVDVSTKDEPLDYLHGHLNLIPGLEKALEGKAVGDMFDIMVEPKEAYGEYLDNLVQRVPAEIFEGDEPLTVGMRFLADTDQGTIPVEITAVEGDEVVVDANHMLAGQTLSFKVEVLDIREATAEEIAHGHVHRAGGCGSEKQGDCCGGDCQCGDDCQCSEAGECQSQKEPKAKKKEGCCGACH